MKDVEEVSVPVRQCKHVLSRGLCMAPHWQRTFKRNVRVRLRVVWYDGVGMKLHGGRETSAGATSATQLCSGLRIA